MVIYCLVINGEATDTFTIITSVNRAEAITQNLPSTTQKSVRYRFNNNSSLVFLTVTPSSAPTVKPNSLPYVGQTGQKIKQYNLYEVQDQFSGEPLYEIRENKTNIDETKGFDTITTVG